MSHRILVLIPYFGEWPAWIDFFIESCRANPTIDWILFSNSNPPENRARNVRHITMSFDAYKDELSRALNVDVSPIEPYKLCDLRPALPYVHRDLARKYDFVGYGDLDVIYGNIRNFYPVETLDAYDLFSTHPDRVSGHFTLMRNSSEMVLAFERIPGWRKAVRSTEYLNFDERGLYNHFKTTRLRSRLSRPSQRCLFRECYTTPGVASDMRWYWQDGRLTNEFYPFHEFVYLHFMSWHSSRWFAAQPNVGPAAAAPWAALPEIVQMDWRAARKKGFMISPDGIRPIERRRYP